LCPRILAGIAAWPLGWLTTPGVVVYERALARIKHERGGTVTAEFARSLVHTVSLPTALACDSDHYVLVAPGHQPRFLTVQEVCRCCGIIDSSPLMRALSTEPLSRSELSANQVVSCLGRGVHSGVACQLVRALVARGLLGQGMSYGSAYSGVDTFAAGVDEALDGQWTYRFASESNKKRCGSLLAAWSCRGLTAGSCFDDSESDAAIGGPVVDLWVSTPGCEVHSKRNHLRDEETQRGSLGGVWRSLEYVRLSRPRVVIVENVAEPSMVGPMTGLLSRLEGYKLETSPLDPLTVARVPICRTRQFWVLVLKA